MTNVTVSETTYNVTVAETNNTVTVGATSGDINVSVNATDLATSIAHSGSQGVEVLKSLESNILTARKIKSSGNDVSVSLQTNDTEIDIVLSDTITVNVSGDLTGNLIGNTTISGNLLPTTDDTLDLGSTTKRFRDLYLGPGSLYINNQKVLQDDSGTIKITTDNGQNLNVQAGGTITMLSTGDTTTLQDGTLNLGKADNSGTINVRGTLDVATKIEMGDLDLTSGSIHQDSSDGNLEIKTNGIGYIHANTADFYIGAGDPASDEFVKVDENSISKIGGGTLTVTGNLVGSVTGQVSDISNHLLDEDNMATNSATKAPSQQSVKAYVTSQIQTKDNTDEIAEGSTNLYYTDARFDTRLATKDTDNISEGSSNLYYTNARFDTRLGTKDTDNLSEGSSNQYFTTARARASISASGSLAYNSGTGALTYTQGNTDTVAEGSSNLYYTDARADARIQNNIIDEDAFGTNSATRAPSQQSVKAYIATQIATKDNSDEITEGSSNLYYTDARARGAISENSTQLAYNSSTGVLTYTQGDTDTVAEGSSNLYHTSARAIAAVEGESTLDLTGALTVDGQISTDNVFKVDDGFTQTSFNPYGAGNDMPTRVCGIGADDGGWASLHVRSRGEHDFGIGSQYNLIPRALMALSAGRKDGSSDDYLNNNDTFGAVMYNPYSGYRTGTEWLTPSATIYGVATEDHSASGMGTKLDFSTTENTNKAGAADLAHTNGVISFQGTTITSSGTLKIDDDLIVTGSISDDGGTLVLNDATDINGLTQVVGATNNKTVIGDQQIASTYNITGVKVQADETKWANILLQEYEGAGGKPASSGFTNPTFGSEIIGGTVASPGAVSADKRLFVLQSLAANATDGTLPTTSNFRILAQTSQAQTSSNRGTFVDIDSTADDSNSTTTSLRMQGNVVQVNPDGNGVLKSGGDLTLDDNVIVTGTIDLKGNISNSAGDVTVNDNLKVNTNLTVDGNTVLGNANTDTITCNAKLTAVNGFVNTILTVASANYLAGLGAIDEGASAYISDANNGGKCLAFFDGSAWKKMHDPTANISAS